MLTCNHFDIDLGGRGAQHEVELKVRAIVLVWDCRWASHPFHVISSRKV